MIEMLVGSLSSVTALVSVLLHVKSDPLVDVVGSGDGGACSVGDNDVDDSTFFGDPARYEGGDAVLCCWCLRIIGIGCAGAARVPLGDEGIEFKHGQAPHRVFLSETAPHLSIGVSITPSCVNSMECLARLCGVPRILTT